MVIKQMVYSPLITFFAFLVLMFAIPLGEAITPPIAKPAVGGHVFAGR